MFSIFYIASRWLEKQFQISNFKCQMNVSLRSVNLITPKKFIQTQIRPFPYSFDIFNLKFDISSLRSAFRIWYSTFNHLRKGLWQ